MGSLQMRGYLIFMLYAVALAFRSLSMILVLTLSLFVFKRLRPKRTLKEEHPKLTKEEKEIIIADWMPEQLVEEYSPELIPEPRIIKGKIMKYIEVDGKHCLNMASNDFLSLVGNKQIEDIAQQTIYKYGVGACGPRNFYGTVDVHLDLEKKLAEFLGCEEAILYSYGFATISSAIPAYSKPGDIIFADKGVNFAIQKGLQASKSKIVWFEHNDMEHLESLLKEQAKIDKKNPRKAAKIRRCIIVEGIYAKTAAICPLPRLVELKWKYKVRIFMDESLSFCVLGRNGKGVTEHFGVDVIDVDLIVASLENALATTGGFCAGRSFVIGHQRLSGLGYCFSASLPPLLATAASEALNIIQTNPHVFDRLQQNSIRLHQKIIDAIKGSNYELIGSEISPLKYVAYSNDQFAEIKLNHLIEELNNNEIFVTRAHYLVDEEMFAPRPTMKIICRVDLTLEEIDEFGQKISLAFKKSEGMTN